MFFLIKWALKIRQSGLRLLTARCAYTLIVIFR